jgi:hypothetical protein
MPLDPLIANPAKLELPNPLADSQMFLQNAVAMVKMGESRRARERAGALRNVFSRLPQMVDGSGVDFAAAPQMLSEQGFGDEALDALSKLTNVGHVKAQTTKEGALADKAGVDANHERLKAKGTWLTNVRTGFEGVQNPEQAKLVLTAAADEAANMGVFTPEGATKWRDLQSSLLDDSVKTGTFTKFIEDHRLGAEKASEKIFTMLPGKDKNQIVASSKFASAPSKSVASVEAPERKGITVNNNMPAEKTLDAFSQGLGKDQVERFGKLETAALGAAARVREIDRLVDIVDSGKLFVGTGAEPKLDALRLASMLGVPVDKDVISNTEEVIAGLTQNTLVSIGRMEQMGVTVSPMSDKDLQMFRDASPQIKNSPEMIKRLLRVERQMYQDAVKMFRARRGAVESNPQTSPMIKAMSISDVPEIPDRAPKAVPQWKAGMTGVNGKPINQKQFNELLADRDNPSDLALFDDWFGAGSAARILGGAPTGDRPLPR